MIPNYEFAAQKAKEIYKKYNTNDPFQIIKDQPNSLILSFRDLSSTIDIDRDVLVMVCGEDNQDAITTVHNDNGNLRYLVVYNQTLQDYELKSAMARELGHIVLKHDGSRLEKVRNEEALCFAYHLICMKEG